MDDYGYFQSGDKARLTRGPLRGREVTLLWYFADTEIWTCSLVIDGVETEYDVHESKLEPLTRQD